VSAEQRGYGRNVRPALRLAALTLLGVALAAALAHPALAQARHPFAVSGEAPATAAGGVAGVILAWQNKFHSILQNASRGLKSDGSAFWTLGAASFAYGVFHAAGPGHGKAVLAAYMIANETALKRGLVLASLAALLQGLVAIAIVGVLALAFNATAQRMTRAASLVELASYAAIAALGARLVWVKGRSFLAAWRKSATAMPSRGGFLCEAVDDPAHVHSGDCGHWHAPDPATLGAGFSWPDALATVVAAGARPCSGAILVLVFTLSQGFFAAGVAAVLLMSAGTAITTGALAAAAVFAKGAARRFTQADSRRSLLLARGAELFAALVVLGLGLALLAGASVSASV
jgi:nickel/cobalt exporter